MAKRISMALGFREIAAECSPENRRALTYNLFVNMQFDGWVVLANKKLH